LVIFQCIVYKNDNIYYLKISYVARVVYSCVL